MNNNNTHYPLHTVPAHVAERTAARDAADAAVVAAFAALNAGIDARLPHAELRRLSVACHAAEAAFNAFGYALFVR